ncbi:hypothetical protein [Streptomyces sp. WAC01280]|uniref:hypothetical protein n=1 Tax=Streptomyces sp. WAC01280 TaxID=2487424 RepID=UPI000F796895|nr:hypothetical protein [Streptomyces sp. WAC01280]RSS57460.1 hypothetical protein EF909_16080 [Streptomyces sp. WAC01280]
MAGIDWGNVPTWLGASFAAGAALAAFLTLASQRRQIREQRKFIEEQSATLALERQELLAVARDRTQAQARQVRMLMDLSGRGVRVTNGSDAPIRDVVVRFGDRPASIAEEVLWDERHGEEFTRSAPRGDAKIDHPPDYLFWSRVAVIGAGKTFHFGAESIDPAQPEAYFTDDAGVRWRLDVHAKLSEHPESQSE